MKKTLALVLATMLAITVFSIDFASGQVIIKSGTSSGGSQSTSCTGEMHYSLIGLGEDYAYAETASLITGNLGATAKIYYNSTSATRTSTATSTQVITGHATVGTGYRATSAKTSHNYYSGTYGSWSATITKSF